jgi:hypothetical protein
MRVPAGTTQQAAGVVCGVGELVAADGASSGSSA